MTPLTTSDHLVPLNREQHRHLKVRPSGSHLAFAKGLNSVLLAASELPLAALCFPCVFVEAAAGQHTLVALTGLRDGENLFIDAQGLWDTDHYLPAFIRRHPFVLSEAEGSHALTVCMDATFDGFSDQEGEPLFEAQGEESAHLKQVSAFLLSFHQDMQRTAQMASHLHALGLLVARNIEFSLGEERFSVAGFQVVDEERLRALSAPVVHGLLQSGVLGWVHAHLLSLNLVSRLGQRLARQTAAAG